MGNEMIYASGGRVRMRRVRMWEVYGELCGVLCFWLGRGDASVFIVASAAGSEDSEFAELEGEMLLLADADGCRLDGLSG